MKKRDTRYQGDIQTHVKIKLTTSWIKKETDKKQNTTQKAKDKAT